MKHEKILSDNGWVFQDGVGYVSNISKYDTLSVEHAEAIRYMFEEFDCEFYWKEDQ